MDNESDQIYLKGGSITYKDNDLPNTATLILDRTADSSWIEELFEVEIKTKGVDEGTWLYRFIGRVGEPTITPGTITLPCVGAADRLRNRFATERFFFDELVDFKRYDVNLGSPNYIDLDAGKRPMRPLIELVHGEYLNNQFDSADYITLDVTNQDQAAQMVFPRNRELAVRFIKASWQGVGNVAGWVIRVSIVGDKLDGSSNHVPDPSVVHLYRDFNIPGAFAKTGSAFGMDPGLITFFLGAEQRYWILYEIITSPATGPGIEIRIFTNGVAKNYYKDGYCADGLAGTFTAYPDRSLYFNIAPGILVPRKELLDFTVDYVNKKVNFDKTSQFNPADGDYIYITYFKGYPTIDDVITAIHDDYLSDFIDANTITPTDKLNLRPFRVEETTILSMIQELLKLGPWSFRIYKDTSANIQFEFVDSYIPSDWGGAPFTGLYAAIRTFYYGGDAAPGEEVYIKIVDDKRVILGAEFVNMMTLKNPDADLAIGVNNPASMAVHGRLSKSTLIVRSADNLDELVSFAEYLFQAYGTQIVEGNVQLDKVSFKTASALFTHCNDLIYIKDTRIGFNGAFKLTRITLSLTSWTFNLFVTNKRPTVTVDKLLSGHSSQFRPSVDFDRLEQKSFRSPRVELRKGDWTQVRNVIGVDDSEQIYNAGYTYKIGVGDSDVAGAVMGNEVARVTCETNEGTGKIHTLDLDGDSSDEYRLAIAIFDKDDFGTSWPYTIKELGLYDNASLKKRLVLKTPWPGSPASEDYFHPFVIVHRDGKLFICWAITA